MIDTKSIFKIKKNITNLSKRIKALEETINVSYDEDLEKKQFTSELAQQDYLKYLEIDANEYRLYIQQLLWISAGMLALMLVTITRFLQLKLSQFPLAIFISMLFFSLTIALTMISLKISSTQYHNRMNALDSKRKSGVMDNEAVIKEDLANKGKRKIERIDFISISSFIIGLILLIVFLFINFDIIVNSIPNSQ